MGSRVRSTVAHNTAAGESWGLIAIGAIINDLSCSDIARYASASQVTVAAEIAEAERAGHVDNGSIIDPRWAASIIERLDGPTLSLLQGALGRRLLTAESDDLDAVIAHCRSAARTLDVAEFISMADHAGRLSLSTRSYSGARAHLTLAVDLSNNDDPQLGERMLLLAQACDGCGDLDTARDVLVRAASLGSLTGDSHLVAEAAVHYALPSDWFAGDHRALELLRMADALDLSDEDKVMVDAASGLVQMRIPVVHDDDNQYAWITRPNTAQPLTDTALEAAQPDWTAARATALLAWRATHRAPQFLAQRCDVTGELAELANRVNDPWKLVMGAEWAAVDAIESGDRAAYDRWVAMARWAAEHDGNPRLRWRAAALSVGGAYLDGDTKRAHDMIAHAQKALAVTSSPCWIGAEILFLGEEVISRDDPAEFATHLDHDSAPSQLNPLAQAGFAYVCARAGQPEMARTYFERSWRALDAESSMLLHASRLAAAAIELDDQRRIDELVNVFTPFETHVVVDAHGWWIDGPVQTWLAMLHAAAGRPSTAREYLRSGELLAHQINDVRTLRRMAHLRSQLDEVSSTATVDRPDIDADVLPERERQVLRLMAEGLTNKEIGEQLAYSVSTIRNSTVAIYKALGVKGRADAVAAAHRRGLLGNA